MPSFKMPEFYMPYPARLNPNLETTRVHAKAWAREMGMLDTPVGAPNDEPGGGVWDERKFNSADYAMFSSSVHPDASAIKLNVVTDWYIWLFYFDDHFLEIYKYSGDMAGAHEFLSRLSAFMPPDPNDTTPMPTNPVEAGLANLWSRTAPAMSECWRSRFIENTYKVLHAPLKELYDVTERQIPNPIDYIETRRNAGGAPWSAGLVEYATDAEVPAEIVTTRTMRVLKDTFADGVHLRNDIFSYEKEVLAGEINGVMVVERFLGCNLQRSVDTVNELATSRMQQFENTALAELPMMVAECGLRPESLQEALDYIKGLQDWMGGDFEWEKKTGRYKDAGLTSPANPARRRINPTGIGTAAARIAPPKNASRLAIEHDGGDYEEATRVLGLTGIGTAAARLGLARRAASVAWPSTAPTGGGEGASRVELPKFYMPFHGGRNAHMDSVRAPAKAWAIEMGMVGSGLPGWDEPGYEAANIPRLTALLHPTAPRPEFDLVTLWSTWAMFLGDFFDEFQIRRDLGGTKVTLARLMAFMPVFPTEAVPVPINPLERGLVDLWPRTAPLTSPDWRRWFASSVKGIVESFQWEILNLTQNRIPDPVDYIEMRRQTCGAELTSLFIHYIIDLKMSPEIYYSQPMRALIETYLEWQGLLNDVFSYQKEIEEEGDFHNGVLVIQRFLDCDLTQAVVFTNDLVTSQLHHFEYIVATEFPHLFDELDMDAKSRESVGRYIRELQECIAGFLEAHVVSVRYESTTHRGTTPATDTPRTSGAPAQARSSFGLTGVGTAAARIGSAAETSGTSTSSVMTRSSDHPSTSEASHRTPFELPEFYLPHPARQNPHLDAALVHTKSWAVQIGMLDLSSDAPDAGVWGEHEFDFMNIVLFTSYTHPDAPAPELELITDWYVWISYFRAHCLDSYNDTRDLVGMQTFLDRLSAFVPLEPSDTTLMPVNPMEMGLADLWPRTAPAMSEHWRARFVENTYDLVQESMLELSNSDRSQVPNPIDYIEMRRKVGGAKWSAGLVEHAVGGEVPAQTAATRVMRVMRDTFADGVHLRNDIFSYPREVVDHGKANNSVLVAERFLSCSPQHAVDVVNDLITSRLQQFENTALTEVPLLVGEYLLEPGAWIDLLQYVNGLQDFQAGAHEWHMRSSHYIETRSANAPVGESRNSARINPVAVDRLGLARRAASVVWPTTASTIEGEGAPRVVPPEIYMPFQAGCNPHVDAVRAPTKVWAIEMGIAGNDSDDDSADIPLLAGLHHPAAPRPEFDMIALWYRWGYFLAAVFDDFQHRRDLAGAKVALARLLTFMPISHPEAVPVPTNPWERGLADLWLRTAPAMSTDWRRWFSGSIKRTYEGRHWEILNLIQNRIPDPVDYVEMRRQNGGSEITSLFVHYILGLQIAPRIYSSRAMRALRGAFFDWEGLLNDSFSYQKEMEHEGDFHNMVLVIQRFLGCALQQAVDLTNDLLTSRLCRFERITDVELPVLFDELGLDAAGREDIGRYVRGLQDCIAGYPGVHLALNPSRYEVTSRSDSDSVVSSPPSAGFVRPPFGPAGLGTAAARIGSLCKPGISAAVSVSAPKSIQSFPSSESGLGIELGRGPEL